MFEVISLPKPSVKGVLLAALLAILVVLMTMHKKADVKKFALLYEKK